MSDSSDSPTRGAERPLKSAYEKALERLAAQGIAPPDTASISDSGREAVAEARRKADAKRAELEILHRRELDATHDTAERERLEKEYVEERRRIDERLEREIERLRRDEAG
ncbi:MAG: hypothetical protein R3244_02720 [Thermoanaerobaculia bacterium]|nr:hypothetical protein [Thermoanaerobaculia bacterium]